MGASFSACAVRWSWCESDQVHRRVGVHWFVRPDQRLALLKRDSSPYEPPELSVLLSAHEAATGAVHDFTTLSTKQSVQQLLSTERHESAFKRLRAKLSVRSQNLMLACSMPHASDWLLAPPIPGLGLGLQSDVVRTAMKFRLGMPVFDSRFLVQRSVVASGLVVGTRWTFLVTTLFVVITALRLCFVTTMSVTF